MDADAQRQIEIFTKALELPEGDREAFLDRECGEDEHLQRKMAALLRAYKRTGGFLEQTLVATAAAKIQSGEVGEKAGDRIGKYRLLQQIGEGGCGVVFLAEQMEPVRRQVALKVLKPGMDTKGVIARFELERQALALMDHPNIAKVFDADTTESGRPYFVMELIRGDKITDYCDRKSLTIEARLGLFAQVCHAVQHAHQKGIIHRDIKPSNILVTTTPEGAALPVVIDFGIAKATTNFQLADETVFTAMEMLMGTPAYMSPEQAALASADVDTRTDIYSLGVLLYELLTGTTPFDTVELLKAGLDEVRRVIREVEPVRPSTRLSTTVGAELTNVSKHHGTEAPRLIRKIRGDLDWIVMKALEKDRARRYDTAKDFAADVGRYLSCEAILARPPSAAYKFHKLVARNKLVFAGVSLIFVLLVISLIATTRWLMIARQTQEDMRQQLEIARLETLAYSRFHDANYAESEQMFRKAFALRRQSHTTELIPLVNIRTLILDCASQNKFDEIRPLLNEFVDPAVLSKPEYKKLSQYNDLYEIASILLAMHGKWKDAAALTEELGKSHPTNSFYYHMRAPLLAASGDVEGYRRFCGEIVSHFRNATNPYVADEIASDCLILPDSGVDLTAVAALADLAAARGSNSSSAQHFKFCKALAEYRLGHYQAATNWAGLAMQGSFVYPRANATASNGFTFASVATESSFVYPRANAAAVMAMSQFKLNQLDKARTTLAYCNEIIEEKMPKSGQQLGDNWSDWIIAHVLQSEAKELIEGGPPAASGPANPPR